MLTYGQSILLGALQGLTELFPISSLGHTVLLPPILGWHINQHEEFFVVFLVATHLATATVLFFYYWNDWKNIILGFFRSLKKGRIPANDHYARLVWLLIVATIPAGLFGLLFDEKLEEFFAAPFEVALFLIGNGILLFGAELLRRRAKKHPEGLAPDVDLARLSFKQALGIGCMQALALFPGFSRTGATVAGGLLAGLSHMNAARFSFLMATPIIAAAGVLKLPQLFSQSGFPLYEILLGAFVSGIAAYITVRFLEKYFKTQTLMPFAVYCVLAGLLALLIVR